MGSDGPPQIPFLGRNRAKRALTGPLSYLFYARPSKVVTDRPSQLPFWAGTRQNGL